MPPEEKVSLPLSQIEQLGHAIGAQIATAIAKSGAGEELGFSLLLFERGRGGLLLYVSDSARDEILGVLDDLRLALACPPTATRH